MRSSFARSIAAVLFTVLAGLIAISAVVAVDLRQATRDHELEIDRHVNEMVLVVRLVSNSEHGARAVRELLLTGAAKDADELRTSREQFHRTLTLLDDAAQSESTRKLYQRIREQQAVLETAADSTLSLRKTEADIPAAAGSLIAHLQPERDKLDALLMTAQDLTESRLLDARQRGRQSVVLAFRWLAVAISAALVLAAFAGAYLIRALRQLDKERASLEDRVAERTRDLEGANSQLKVLAQKDGLTGAWNRSAFDARLMDEAARADRYGLPLALALVDIDHFKSINDQFGHQTGDDVIRKIAGVLKDSLRGTDMLARYGGEEFAVILVNTDREGAAQVAERIRSDVENANWPHGKVTVSVGVASWAPSLRTPEALLRRADEALYASKNGGRNRVTYADAPLADA